MSVRLADILVDGDFLARDIVYHNSCKMAHWKRQQKQSTCTGTESSASPSSGNPNMAAIVAEVEFFADTQEQFKQGEYIPINVLENLYNNKRDVLDLPPLNRPSFIKKLTTFIPEAVVTPQKDPKPFIVHSQASGNRAVMMVT